MGIRIAVERANTAGGSAPARGTRSVDFIGRLEAGATWMFGCRAALIGLLLLVGAIVRAALPPPLDTVCVMDVPQGCYADSFRRTFPVAVSDGVGMPFANNMTLETCAYLCHKSSLPGAPFGAAAVESGSQCFCVSTAALAAAEPNRTSMQDCTTLPTRDQTESPGGLAVPCVGNPFQMCGGAWRLFAFNFTCQAYSHGGQKWQNHTLSPDARVADLVARLSPPQLIAQLYMNGADIYGPNLQLPRYIPTQECLAGMDGGSIFLAPKINATPSSAFPQPVNMGNTFDVELVREIAAAISDEARAAFNHVGRPSLTCMSPNLNGTAIWSLVFPSMHFLLTAAVCVLH